MTHDVNRVLDKIASNKAREVRRRTAIPGWVEDESRFPECEMNDIMDMLVQAFEAGKSACEK